MTAVVLITLILVILIAGLVAVLRRRSPPLADQPFRFAKQVQGAVGAKGKRPFPYAKQAKAATAIAAIGWSLLPVLHAPNRPLEEQPFPDSVVYADAARQIAAGNGYVTVVDERIQSPLFGERRLPPRFPFGTSVALAPFAKIMQDFPENVQIGNKVITAGYLVAIAAAAWVLAGPLAGAIAAVFVSSSPFLRVSSALVLSDALGAALVVLILIALTRESRLAMAVAGALAGAAVDVRLLAIVVPLALFVTVGKRFRWHTVGFAAPFVIALLLYQWGTFGSPFRTGYDYWLQGARTFGGSYVATARPAGVGSFVVGDRLQGALVSSDCPCPDGGPPMAMPNFAFYGGMALGLFWVFAPPLVPLVGLIQMVRDREQRAAKFAIVLLGLNFLVILFYFGHDSRLIAPALSVLVVFGSKWCAIALKDAVRRGLDGPVVQRLRKQLFPSTDPVAG